MLRIRGLKTLLTLLVCVAVTLPKRPPCVPAYLRAGVSFNAMAAPTKPRPAAAQLPPAHPCLCQASGGCQATRTYLPLTANGELHRPTSIFLRQLRVRLLGKVREPPARGPGYAFKRGKVKPQGTWPEPRPGPGCPCSSLGSHQTLARRFQESACVRGERPVCLCLLCRHGKRQDFDVGMPSREQETQWCQERPRQSRARSCQQKARPGGTRGPGRVSVVAGAEICFETTR